MFKKWYTACFKTYADVFIRLAAIYFALYLINLLTSNPDAFVIGYCDPNDASCVPKTLGLGEQVFVILGILMFAKQFPDLLKDLLGIDLKGNFTLNPMKKIGENAPLAAAAIGMGTGAIGGVIGNIMASREAYKGQGFNGFFKGAGQALGGIFTGAARGAHAGYGSKGSKLFGTSWNAAGKGGQNIINKQGTSSVGRNVAKVQTGLGIHTKADRLDAESKAYSTVADIRKEIRDAADYDTNKYFWYEGGVRYETSTKAAKQEYEDAMNSGASSAEVEAKRKVYEKVREMAIDNASTQKPDGTYLNAEIKAKFDKLNRHVENNKHLETFKNMGNISTDSELSSALGQAKTANATLTSSVEWDTAHANQNYAKTGSSGKK